MIQELKKLRQKYVDAELAHYRKTNEKSKTLRAKISVLTELANNISLLPEEKTIKEKLLEYASIQDAYIYTPDFEEWINENL